MGRPREHDDKTRRALRSAAERLLADGGTAALSVRAVATEAGTSTRAVYSLFGSKEGLLVDALAQDAYEFLFDRVAQLHETEDVAADLVDVGVLAFRSLVLEHPALYRIAFQRIVPDFQPGPEVMAARNRAWSQLVQKVQRVGNAGLLGDLTENQAAIAFNAMMEGLANAELRGSVLRNLPEGEEQATWHQVLTSLVSGFGATRRLQAPN
jgi:AcrR family transcriptional regulator